MDPQWQGMLAGPDVPKLLTGFALNSPDSPDSHLMVEIEQFGRQPWGPAPFMPKPGGAVPVKGTRLLVAIDEQGNPWVVVWEGEGSGGDKPAVASEGDPPDPAPLDPTADGTTATVSDGWMPGVRKLERSFGSWAVSCPAKGILHTTEGTGDATGTLDAKNAHPHFQVEESGRITQYISVNNAAKALVHPSFVQTNNAHAIQIEICAFAATVNTMPDIQHHALRRVMRFIEQNAGVERASHHAFGPPDHPPARLSAAGWLAATGWLGHQHVPGNDHVDPGSIDIGGLL